MEKYVEGRVVKCHFEDLPAVAYLHATAFLFGGGPSPTDAYPVCEYCLRRFIRERRVTYLGIASKA